MDSYTKVLEKGHGGYGIVYHVKNDNGEDFALKSFSINQGYVPSLEEEAHFKKRFIREVITQQGIVSHNIVKIIEYDFVHQPMFYIMPLALCTLKDELDLGKLSDAEKINIIYDILNGLESIHDLGLCHRDLKPSNVLKFIDDEGHFYYAISDFGLISKNNTSTTTLTSTGTQKSDDHYTAIELHVDFKNATLKSDIYSVGCIIHDLFFPSDPRPPMREINVSNSTWQDILAYCTKDNVDDRYDSIEDLRNDIFKLNLNDNTESKDVINHFEFLDNDSYFTANSEQWDILVKKLEEEDELSSALHYKLDTNHILHLIGINYGKIDILADAHAKWISKHSFNFNYCDILAYKIKLLYDATKLSQSNIGAKSQCLITLLFLGTSHNRFYVERMFVSLIIDQNFSDKLANRLALEFRLNADRIKNAINHLEYSVSFNVNNFHPALLDAYNKL